MKRKGQEELSSTTCKKVKQNPNPPRTVIPQTWYRFDSLEHNGFADVCDLLKFQGWSFICSEEFAKKANGFDVELVRQFYAQLHVVEEDHSKMESNVNRKKIRFGDEDITTFISSLSDAEGNMNSTDSRLTLQYNEFGKTFENFDPKTDVAPLLKPVFSTLTKPTASNLTVPNRLLLHIIYNCIIPKSGSRTYLPNMVLALLHYINTKQKVNLAHLMMGHMLSVRNHCLQKLPHATFVTYWLQKQWKVSPKELNAYYLTYDNVNLTHMFTFDENTGIWSSKAEPSMDTPKTEAPALYLEDPSLDTPSNPLPTHQQQHHASSSSDPSVTNSMLSDVLAKLDLLSINTPSVAIFNSASQQLVTENWKFHDMTCRYLRKIEDKVDRWDDQMKGYGHNNLECVRKIHKDQEALKFQLFVNVEEQMEKFEQRMKAVEEHVAAIRQMVSVMYSTQLSSQLKR